MLNDDEYVLRQKQRTAFNNNSTLPFPHLYITAHIRIFKSFHHPYSPFWTDFLLLADVEVSGAEGRTMARK